MADELMDFDGMIAQLRQRREAFNQGIDTAIDGLERARAIVGGIPSTSPTTGPTLAAGTFLGLSLVEAAKKALKANRKPMTNQELAAALEAGGFLHTSTNFTNQVGTTLWRAESNGDREIVRNGRQWLMREWAPGLRRSRGDDGERPVVSLNPNSMVPDEDSGS